MKHHYFAALLFLGVCGPPLTYASAQSAATASVAAAGAVRASNAVCRLQATVGQGAVGHGVGSSTAVDLGFWHPLPRASANDASSQTTATGAASASVTVAPNPFAGATQIQLRIPQAGHVSLTLYNLLGQPLYSLLDSPQPQGTSFISLDAGDLPSGTYTLVLKYREGTSNTSITIMR